MWSTISLSFGDPPLSNRGMYYLRVVVDQAYLLRVRMKNSIKKGRRSS